MTTKAKAPFSGKHMAAILIAGFGIVAAVNFFMASLATGGFHGVVVDNSYVASQKFNDWLEEADRARALGWDASASRTSDGYVVVSGANVPAGAVVSAELRRPLGERQYADLVLMPFTDADGTLSFRSTESIADGRWTIRLMIEANGETWAEESELR